MSDSGISEASNDYIYEPAQFEDVFDEDEKENDDTFDISQGNKNLSASSLSKSNIPLSPFRSLIPVPVADIKNLNNDYQKLLRRATREIKKLNLDVQKLEQEQEKLLQANVNLAHETENLVLDQNAWKKDEQALINTNGELTKELEKMHKVEQEQGEEIKSLENQIKQLQEKLSVQNQKRIEEKNNWKTEIVELTESLNVANEKSTRLLAKVKSMEEEYSSSVEHITSSYANDRVILKAKINSLEDSLDKEKQLRKKGDVKAGKLIQELEKSNDELETLPSLNPNKEDNLRKELGQLDLEIQLLVINQKFMNIKNEKMKKELKVQCERVKPLNKILSAENQLLKTNLKLSHDDNEKHVLKTKKELVDEKEKIKSQVSWKFWKHRLTNSSKHNTGPKQRERGL